jgi:hypothetical protein
LAAALGSELDEGSMRAWFVFKEVKQNWLGFCLSGNTGRGLGPDFAIALHRNFNTTFKNFGEEDVAESSHFEKLTLFESGVGRDNVSDFTTNLIKKYLLEYTQEFARQYVEPALIKTFAVQRAYFSYKTESWVSKSYRLPAFFEDFVLLTPEDLLTKDELWINHNDLVGDYSEIVDSIPNVQLRRQINNYFSRQLSIILERKERKRREALSKRKRKKRPIGLLKPLEPTEADNNAARWQAIHEFPQIIDYYLALKEKHGERAVRQSRENVDQIEMQFIEHVEQLVSLLEEHTKFYSEPSDTGHARRPCQDRRFRYCESEPGEPHDSRPSAGNTCRRNSWRVRRSISAPTYFRWVRSSTTWLPASALFKVTVLPFLRAAKVVPIHK